MPANRSDREEPPKQRLWKWTHGDQTRGRRTPTGETWHHSAIYLTVSALSLQMCSLLKEAHLPSAWLGKALFQPLLMAVHWHKGGKTTRKWLYIISPQGNVRRVIQKSIVLTNICNTSIGRVVMSSSTKPSPPVHPGGERLTHYQVLWARQKAQSYLISLPLDLGHPTPHRKAQ